MDGVINIFKHPGVSSHDIVLAIRKLLNIKKVGHTGTLDPDAVGVLPVCVGKGTRLVEYLTSSKKTYRVLLKFGYETDTQDSSGNIIKKTELPPLTEIQFKNVLNKFLGEIEQIPPIYSAIKKNGQPLYKLAREGKKVEIEPRKIKIYKINLLNYDRFSALLEVTCSKGTYIRTLCQDIGRAANSSAYMSFLLRIQSGNFHINNAYTLEEIPILNFKDYLVPLAKTLPEFPVLKVSNEILKRIKNGNKIHISKLQNETVKKEIRYKILNNEEELIAICMLTNNYLKPEKVFG